MSSCCSSKALIVLHMRVGHHYQYHKNQHSQNFHLLPDLEVSWNIQVIFLLPRIIIGLTTIKFIIRGTLSFFFFLNLSLLRRGQLAPSVTKLLTLKQIISPSFLLLHVFFRPSFAEGTFEFLVSKAVLIFYFFFGFHGNFKFDALLFLTLIIS